MTPRVISASGATGAGADARVLAMAMAERQRVTDLISAQFRALPLVDRECCVDDAFDELYQGGAGPLVNSETAFRAQWIKIARWRALDACRRLHSRGRVRRSVVSWEDVGRDGEQGGVLGGACEPAEERERDRADYRAEELLAALDEEERALAEVLFGADPSKRAPRYLRSELGWSEHHWEWVLRKMREHVRAFLAARESGALCTERRELLSEYLEWSLITRSAAAGLCSEERADPERFRLLWLHLHGCESCDDWARQVHHLEGAIEYALLPPLPLAAGALAFLAHLLAAGKARAVSATASLLPARVRAAGGGGGATGAALSGIGGKAAVCVTAAVCAATGVIASGAVPVVLHHHHAVATHRPKMEKARAAQVAARPLVVRQESQRVSTEPIAAPARPVAAVATRSEAPLVLKPAPREEPPAPRANLPAPEEAHASTAAGAGAAESSAGCTTPGDLGC